MYCWVYVVDSPLAVWNGPVAAELYFTTDVASSGLEDRAPAPMLSTPVTYTTSTAVGEMYNTCT